MDPDIANETSLRRQLCEVAAEKFDLPPATLEKDFWVCWLLERTINYTEAGQYLTFKGGTSLSKGWKLIQRFSEDIDLVVDKAALGFAGDALPDAPHFQEVGQGKRRERQLTQLRSKCEEFVRHRLLVELEAALGKGVTSQPYSLRLSEADAESILFYYPTAYPTAESYVSPVVKLELGARSNTEPNEDTTITTFLCDADPSATTGSNFRVKTVLPVRTLVEKLMLLHEERMRGSGRPPQQRLARHYYDVWHLVRAGVGEHLLENPDLYWTVARHRAVYFSKAKGVHSSLLAGDLNVQPVAQHLQHWRTDFQRTRDELVRDEPPQFDSMVHEILEFQEQLVRRLRDGKS